MLKNDFKNTNVGYLLHLRRCLQSCLVAFIISISRVIKHVNSTLNNNHANITQNSLLISPNSIRGLCLVGKTLLNANIRWIRVFCMTLRLHIGTTVVYWKWFNEWINLNCFWRAVSRVLKGWQRKASDVKGIHRWQWSLTIRQPNCLFAAYFIKIYLFTKTLEKKANKHCI